MGPAVKGTVQSVGTLTRIILVYFLVVGPLGLPGRPMMLFGQFPASHASVPGKTTARTMMIADNHDGSRTEPRSSPGQQPPASEDRRDDRPNSEPDQKTEKRPLKPFKPSERIKADQAVDFPSDI